MKSKKQRKSTPYNSFVNRLDLRLADLVIISLFLIVLTLTTRLPLLSDLSELYISGNSGDAALYTWAFKYNISQMFTEGWFNTKTFYPYSQALAWSDNFLLPALFGKLLQFMGLGPVLSYNLMLLVTTFLNGFCTFLLCKQLTGRRGPALVGATLFLSYSYLTFHLGHTQLQFAFWLPLSCFLLLSFFTTTSLLTSIALGLSIVGAFLCGVYYAIFDALLISILFVLILISRPKALTADAFKILVVGIIVGFLPIIPFLMPYLDVMATFEKRHLYEPQAFGAHFISYFSATPLNYLYSATSKYSHPEANLFPGVLVILLSTIILFRLRIKALKQYNCIALTILAALLISSASLPEIDPKIAGRISDLDFKAKAAIYICIISSWLYAFFGLVYLYKLGKIERSYNVNFLTNRSLIAIFHYTAVLFFIFSLGPIWPPKLLNKFPAFFTAFFYLFPGMGAIRAISRIGVVVILSLTVLSSFSTQYFFKKFSKRNYFIAASIIIIIFENLCYKIPYAEPEIQVPAVFKKAAKLAQKNDAAIVLPLTTKLRKSGAVENWSDFAIQNVNAMHITSSVGLKVFNGYSGQRTKLMQEYPRKMANFPDERSIKALMTISGLRFVFFNKYDEPTYDEEKFNERLSSFNNTIKKLGEDSTGWMLFELIPDFEISDDFFLQVPSTPQGKLSINLRSKEQQKEDLEVNFSVIIRTNKKPLKKSFYSAIIPADTKWHLLTIQLPKTQDSVRPLKVVIKTKNSEILHLGKSQFEKYSTQGDSL